MTWQCCICGEWDKEFRKTRWLCKDCAKEHSILVNHDPSEWPDRFSGLYRKEANERIVDRLLRHGVFTDINVLRETRPDLF